MSIVVSFYCTLFTEERCDCDPILLDHSPTWTSCSSRTRGRCHGKRKGTWCAARPIAGGSDPALKGKSLCSPALVDHGALLRSRFDPISAQHKSRDWIPSANRPRRPSIPLSSADCRMVAERNVPYCDHPLGEGASLSVERREVPPNSPSIRSSIGPATARILSAHAGLQADQNADTVTRSGSWGTCLPRTCWLLARGQ